MVRKRVVMDEERAPKYSSAWSLTSVYCPARSARMMWSRTASVKRIPKMYLPKKSVPYQLEPHKAVAEVSK